jgi:phospholipase C
LKLIEWRWNLKPLTARDTSADVGNLAFALDLAHPDATVPALPTPVPPAPLPCAPLASPAEVGLQDLLALAPVGGVPAP